jgi:hypothetical protein
MAFLSKASRESALPVQLARSSNASAPMASSRSGRHTTKRSYGRPTVAMARLNAMLPDEARQDAIRERL